LAARRAGISAATAVMMMPTANAAITVRSSITGLADGSPAPNAPNSACSPIATPTPGTEADGRRDPADHHGLQQHRPGHLPLGGAERPHQGELLVRWATRIENVLKMMNAPTNSATAGEHQQERVEEAESCWMSLACSSPAACR
jgi:hypothetical protein